MPAISTGLALGLAGIATAGSIGGGAIAASGASKAAGAQTDAANYAANLQHQDAQSALQFQQQQLALQQQNMAPWLKTGAGALGQLSNLLGINSNNTATLEPWQTAGQGAQQSGSIPLSNLSGLPAQRTGGPVSQLRMAGTFSDAGRVAPTSPIRVGNENGVSTGNNPGQVNPNLPVNAAPNGPGTPGFGSLLQGYDKQFVAPTGATEQNDPGYKFRLDQGMQALQNSAAARGGLLSGNTAKAITDYAQNYASNEYGSVYNRALGEYQQGYNIFQNDQSNKFNRLSALSGTGQTAASQLNSASQGAAGNVSNILLGSGQQIGQDIQNAGAATASGYAAGANAFGGAVSGIGNNLTNLLLLSQLKGPH